MFLMLLEQFGQLFQNFEHYRRMYFPNSLVIYVSYQNYFKLVLTLNIEYLINLKIVKFFSHHLFAATTNDHLSCSAALTITNASSSAVLLWHLISLLFLAALLYRMFNKIICKYGIQIKEIPQYKQKPVKFTTSTIFKKVPFQKSTLLKKYPLKKVPF